MEWILITVFFINGTSGQYEYVYKTKEACVQKGEAWKKEVPTQSEDFGTSYYKCVPKVIGKRNYTH